MGKRCTAERAQGESVDTKPCAQNSFVRLFGGLTYFASSKAAVLAFSEVPVMTWGKRTPRQTCPEGESSVAPMSCGHTCYTQAVSYAIFQPDTQAKQMV